MNMDFLYYHTPPNQFKENYGNFQAPFNSKKIFTQLPKNIVAIRVVATLAFTALAALKLSATIFCWPIVVAGVAFAGWNIYFHLLSKDPLMETFYKIVGGKNKFEELPNINLAQAPHEKVCEAIERLNWNDLDQPIYQTKTLDGRHIVIIKGLSREKEGPHKRDHTKGVLAFVEKLSPAELGVAIVHAIVDPFKGNTFGHFLYLQTSQMDDQRERRYCHVYSSISSKMANEFFAQLSPEALALR